MFGAMAPWLGTMVVVSFVSLGMGTFMEHFDPQIVLMAGTPVMVAIIALGSFLTFQMHRRRPVPNLELEIDRHEIRLHQRGKAVLATSRQGVQLRRALHVIPKSRGLYPSIKLTLGGRTLHIAVYDPRFGWSDQVRASWGVPTYLVGAPDWKALINALDLRGVAS